jgi:hypothetical protein
MELLCVLCVIIVCRAKTFNELLVMASKMKFWNVEVCSNTKINEDILAVMERFQSIIEDIQGFTGVNWILCKIKEVHQSSHCADQMDGGHVVWELNANDESKEKL